MNEIIFRSDPDKTKIPFCSSEKIKILENTTLFNPLEKVRILAILIGKRWLADVLIDRETKPLVVAVESCLNNLELVYQLNSYPQQSGKVINWISVTTNQAILDYLETNKKRMSVIEAGILYGYQPTAIIACAGLIPKKKLRKNSPVEYCLGGVFSERFYDLEQRQLKLLWQEIQTSSQKIAKEAENYFEVKK